MKRLALVQEAQFLRLYFTPPRDLPMILPDLEVVLPGKKIHPVVYQHAHGAGVPADMLAEGVKATAVMDERHVGLLLSEAGRLQARRLADGRLAFYTYGEPGAGKQLAREEGIRIGVEIMVSTVPFSDTIKERVMAVSRVDCGNGVTLIVKAQCKLYDGGDVIAVFSNHSKSFQRWFDLYLDMLFTGAPRGLIVFHQKMCISRFEHYDFGVVESMCEAEALLMRQNLGNLVAQVDRAVTESDTMYEVLKKDNTVTITKM